MLNIYKSIIFFFKWWLLLSHISYPLYIYKTISVNFKRLGLKFLLLNIFNPLFGFSGIIDHLISVLVRVGHLIAIFGLFLFLTISQIAYKLLLLMVPFMFIVQLFSKHTLNLPIFVYVIFLGLVLIDYYFDDEIRIPTIKSIYKSKTPDLVKIVSFFDRDLMALFSFLKKRILVGQISDLILFSNLMQKHSLVSFLKDEEIYDLFSGYNPPSEVSSKISEIIINSFILARDLNLSTISTKEFLISYLNLNQDLIKFLENKNFSVMQLKKLNEHFYFKKKLDLSLKKHQRESRYRFFSKVNRGMTGKLSPVADRVTTDLTRDAYKFSKEPFIGRDKEYETLINILKNNKPPLIIGKSGSGKTALIKHLALNMNLSEIPSFLEDKRLVQLDITSIIENKTNSDNVLESLTRVLSDIEQSGHLILVIDDLDMLLNSSSNGFAILDLIVKFLETKKIPFIATCNFNFYSQIMQKKPEVSKVFSPVNLVDLDTDKTMEILKYKASSLEFSHKITFSLAAIEEAYNVSQRFIHDIAFPKKALILLEEALMVSANKINIGRNDILDIVKAKYGINLSAVKEDESDFLKDLENQMHKRVIGQDLAVKEISNTLRRVRLNVSKENGPLASFLFLGPTGIGKTELAKTTAEIFFNNSSNFLRLDMSEYPDKQSIYKLIGYHNNNEYVPGLLTEPIRANPFCLILLDEIEKADRNVLNTFLQLLDDGRLTDGKGYTVNFNNTIIIATSNVGNKYIEEQFNKGGDYKSILDELRNNLLLNNFSPEFLNRFTELLVFSPLTVPEIHKVVILILDNIKKNQQKNGINIIYNDELVDFISRTHYNPIYGARNIKNNLIKLVNNVITNAILEKGLNSNIEIELKPEDFK